LNKHNTYWFWLILGTASAAAGWLLALPGIPAAWLLGPMIVAGTIACLRPERRTFPPWVEHVGQAVIGGTVSTAITPNTLTVFLHYWWAILLIIGALLAFSLLSGALLARISSHIELGTALLGMLPGGAPGMVALSDALHSDTRLVAVMQMLRVMLVLGLLAIVATLVAPPPADNGVLPGAVSANTGLLPLALTLAITFVGAWFGLRLHLPAGALVGPAVLGTLLGLIGLSHAEWPELVLRPAYMVVGISVGLQFDLQAMRTAGKLVPLFLASTLLLIIGAALMGWALALLTGIDLFSAYLATTPGGLNMVTIIALDSGADVALVLTLGLLRFLIIMLAAPHVVRWLVGRYAHEEEVAAPFEQNQPREATRQ
jgi:hypothetical protein